MTPVTSNCQSLAAALTQAKSTLKTVTQEYNESTGQEKSRLFYLMREATTAVAQAQQKLNLCTNPPPPLPDLIASAFTFRWHSDKKAFDFAVQVQNAGSAVSGPFKITLGAQYISDNSQQPPLYDYAEISFEVPSTTTIEMGDTYTSQYFLNIPFIVAPGTSSAPDMFYAFVDADEQIQESDKTNNSLTLFNAMRPPRVVGLPGGTTVHPPLAAHQ
jgi:hypothetical protein